MLFCKSRNLVTSRSTAIGEFLRVQRRPGFLVASTPCRGCAPVGEPTVAFRWCCAYVTLRLATCAQCSLCTVQSGPARGIVRAIAASCEFPPPLFLFSARTPNQRGQGSVPRALRRRRGSRPPVRSARALRSPIGGHGCCQQSAIGGCTVARFVLPGLIVAKLRCCAGSRAATTLVHDLV